MRNASGSLSVLNMMITRWRETFAAATYNVDHNILFNHCPEEVVLPDFSFRAPDDDDLCWALVLAPKQREEGDAGWVGDLRYMDVFLTFKSASGREKVFASIFVEGTLSIKGSLSDVCKMHNIADKENLNILHNVIYVDVQSREHVGTITMPLGDVRDLTLVARVRVTDRVINADLLPPPVVGAAVCAPPIRKPESVAANLGALLKSGDLADAWLCVNDQELPAHRAVLAACSNVFKTMFQTECSEKTSGKVAIGHFSLGAVQEMLRFMYTGCAGEADLSDSLLIELVVAGDMYMMDALVEEASRCLARRLNASPTLLKLCDVLRVAHLVRSERLRRVALHHLRLDRDLILKSQEWRDLVADNKTLAAECLMDALMPCEGNPKASK